MATSPRVRLIIDSDQPQIGQIRIGRILCHLKGGRTVPSWPGFTPIEVMTPSSPYGDLGPYVLRNDQGQLMENIWQFSKVYPEVPISRQYYSRWDRRVTWDHPAETHTNSQGLPNDKYWAWRYKGFNCPDPIRYPVGYHHRHTTAYSLGGTDRIVNPKPLILTEARKEIYLKTYLGLLQSLPRFQELRERHRHGENLLILEVDGPHQESLEMYQGKYQVGPDFIVNNTMEATPHYLNIMLQDVDYSFGHGYCLAWALLELNVN